MAHGIRSKSIEITKSTWRLSDAKMGEKSSNLEDRVQQEVLNSKDLSSVGDERDCDIDFLISVAEKQKKKIYIMGSISLSADRVNVSYPGRTMIAASAVNALGIDINCTNTSKTTGSRRAK